MKNFFEIFIHRLKLQGTEFLFSLISGTLQEFRRTKDAGEFDLYKQRQNQQQKDYFNNENNNVNH